MERANRECSKEYGGVARNRRRHDHHPPTSTTYTEVTYSRSPQQTFCGSVGGAVFGVILLIGATVLRRLDSAAQTTSAQAVHKGVVIEHDEWTGFRVLYSDGDCEDLTLRELKATLLRSGVEEAAVEGRVSPRNGAPSGAEGAEQQAEGAPTRRLPMVRLAGA